MSSYDSQHVVVSIFNELTVARVSAIKKMVTNILSISNK